MADAEGTNLRTRKPLPSSRPIPFHFVSRWARDNDSSSSSSNNNNNNSDEEETEIEEISEEEESNDDEDGEATGNANNNMASNANNNNMANNANPPALPAPNQGQQQVAFGGQPQAAFAGQPQVPFAGQQQPALAPVQGQQQVAFGGQPQVAFAGQPQVPFVGQQQPALAPIQGQPQIAAAAPNQGNQQPVFAPDPSSPGAVLCPLCAHPNNTFRQTSMRLHFQRKHNAQFQQWFGVAPPNQFHCPHNQCNAGPFSRRSDLTDHLSEIHNQVPVDWRLKYNKQKRRQLGNLLNDCVNEAAALNTLIGRIAAAEANQPGQYVSTHGLPLGVWWPTDPAQVPNQTLTVPLRREAAAGHLIQLRNTADQRGVLLSGVLGSWNQVADELEARIAAYQAQYNFLGPA